jgi:Na+-translocating ferredoxin:NAD+ oxidoreductase RnfD subunit
MWSPYKPECNSAYRTKSTVFDTANSVTKSTSKYVIKGSALKANWVNDCTECVRCEYLCGKRTLLKQGANKESCSLLFIAALFVLFVTNNKTGDVRIT